ncbi:uncharacterized protein [Henckelia pumila]|uniref:uncharacterized protein n=1 Tax=Henckelia pumila TaxID=405737 RepID=UPI003C6E1D72
MLRKDSTKDRAITGSQELPRRRKSPGPFDLTRRSGPPPKKSDAHDKKIGGKRKNVVAGPNVDARDREVDDMRNAKRKRDEERVVHLDALKGRHLFVEGVNQKNNAGSFWDLKDLEIGWRTEADLIGDHDRLHLLPQPTEVLTRTLASSAFQVSMMMSM